MRRGNVMCCVGLFDIVNKEVRPLRASTPDFVGWVERSNRTLVRFDRDTHHLARGTAVDGYRSTDLA